MKKSGNGTKGSRKVYVITGGPCIGKTTILNDLKAKGFHVMHEIARAVIEEQQKKEGGILPWTDIKKFQEVVLEAQLREEEKFPGEIVFIDRGIGDILAYCDVYGIEPPELVAEYSRPPRYHKIILLERLLNYEKDHVRLEDEKLAIKIHDAIEMVYRKLGYEIIKAPPLPPKERLGWLLEKLELDGRTSAGRVLK